MTDIECARTVTWAGTSYALNLNHRWVRNVLDYRGINGIPAPACLQRFESGAYQLDDVSRILELGLIGAGMDERGADALVEQHVRTKPIAANAVIAFETLAALFIGKNVNVVASA